MSAYPARRIKVRGGLGSLRASTVARSHNITSRFGYVAAPRLYFNRASSSRQWRASSRSTPPLSPPSLNSAIKYLSFVMTFPLNVAKQRICVLGVLPRPGSKRESGAPAHSVVWSGSRYPPRHLTASLNWPSSTTTDRMLWCFRAVVSSVVGSTPKPNSPLTCYLRTGGNGRRQPSPPRVHDHHRRRQRLGGRNPRSHAAHSRAHRLGLLASR